MAVTVTRLFDGVQVKQFGVVATDDADTTTGLIDHGLQGTPIILGLAASDQVPAAASQWAVQQLTDTQFEMTKTGGAIGSGGVGTQVLLTLAAPNADRIG